MPTTEPPEDPIDFPEPAPARAPKPSPDPGETLEAKRSRLLEEKKKRDAAEVDAAKAREVEALELEARFCSELGPLGLAFDILPTRVGPVVLKLPAEVHFKEIRAAFIDRTTLPTQEALAGFVTPNVIHPERNKFLAMVGKYPGIFVSAGTLVAALCNAEEIETRGK